MDSENTNHANYCAELQFVTRLIKALELILRVVEDNPVRYPALISDVICLIEGRVVHTDNGDFFCNGLAEQICELYDTQSRLIQEVEYECDCQTGDEEDAVQNSE